MLTPPFIPLNDPLHVAAERFHAYCALLAILERDRLRRRQLVPVEPRMEWKPKEINDGY